MVPMRVNCLQGETVNNDIGLELSNSPNNVAEYGFFSQNIDGFDRRFGITKIIGARENCLPPSMFLAAESSCVRIWPSCGRYLILEDFALRLEVRGRGKWSRLTLH